MHKDHGSNPDISRQKKEIDNLISHSTTKLISPLLVLFYLDFVNKSKRPVVENSLVKEGYEETVCTFVKNNFIISTLAEPLMIRISADSALAMDSSTRLRKENSLSKKNILPTLKNLPATLAPRLKNTLTQNCEIIILKKLVGTRRMEPNDRDIRDARDFLTGVLRDNNGRRFVEFLEAGFDKNADGFLSMSYGFEICMFSILKIFLAKFGCKLYRDSRTYSVDKGGDISTNFGVVYQIKNYCLTNEEKFSELLNELFLNFSDGRIQQGNVFLIVKEASDGIMAQLKKQSIGCITKKSVTDLLDKLTSEEKSEVLISAINEFNRELVSDVCRLCKKPGKTVCPYSVGVEIERAKATNTTTSLNAFL